MKGLNILTLITRTLITLARPVALVSLCLGVTARNGRVRLRFADLALVVPVQRCQSRYAGGAHRRVPLLGMRDSGRGRGQGKGQAKDDGNVESGDAFHDSVPFRGSAERPVPARLDGWQLATKRGE